MIKMRSSFKLLRSKKLSCFCNANLTDNNDKMMGYVTTTGDYGL